MNLTYYTLARTPQEAAYNLTEGLINSPTFILSTSKREVTQRLFELPKSEFAEGLDMFAISVIVEKVK